MRLSRACYSNINNQGKRSDSFRRSHLKKFQLLSDQVAQLCFSNNDAEEMNPECYMRVKLALISIATSQIQTEKNCNILKTSFSLANIALSPSSVLNGLLKTEPGGQLLSTTGK